ncbi:hypothetical protein BDD12DRAFT_804853 [Trichophaea hybrida]|nr:hypothetical protein BDD12DRAFT_804853 [Trichophaea hybrida]
MFPSPKSTPFKTPQIHDLDFLIMNSSIAGSDGCIGIFDEDKEAFRIFSSTSPVSYQHVVSLKTLLRHGTLKVRDRLELGVVLADMVLLLHSTEWLGENWGTRDIFFPQKIDIDGTVQPCINLPCLRRQFGLEPHHSHIQQEPVSSLRVGYGKTLFCLGIVLIELWFERPIEELGPPQSPDENQGEHKKLFEVAQQCMGRLFASAGELYGLSVSRCLNGMDRPSGARNLQNEDYMAKVYTNIVVPLERSLKLHSDKYS